MNRLTVYTFFKKDHFKKEMNHLPSSIFPGDMGYVTLPETNGSHLKMGGWKMISLEGRPIFRGFCCFRGESSFSQQPGFNGSLD